MKARLFAIALTLLLGCYLFAGCAAASAAGNPAPATSEKSQEEPASQTSAPAQIAPVTTAPAKTVPETAAAETAAASAQNITEEQAKTIALEHAGYTADQVNRLRVEYDFDDRIPHYEVEFHYENWEYDYEVNADTGEILAFEKDD